jgi:hypothetical protein
MGLARLLSYFLGLSAFLLSVAVFHIGGSTGVQLFCLIGIGVFLALKGAAPPRFLIWFAGLCMLIFSSYLLQLQYGGDAGVPFKGLISFSLNLMVVWLGASLVAGARGTHWPIYLRGYMMGAMLSSVLAIVQATTWGVMRIPTSAVFGIHNNRSFTDVTTAASVFDSARGFAMTAEPSLLALLLLPAAILLWVRGRYVPFLFIACGMYASQSLTAAVCLTGFILWRFMFGQGASGWAKKIIGFGVGLTAVAFITAALLGTFATDTVSAAGRPGVQARVFNAAADPSTLSRLNSVMSGFSAILERPAVGWGMQSEDLKYFLLSRATFVEANDAINSLALSLAAWFGIPLTLYLLYVPARFWLLTRVNSEVKLFVLASVIPPMLTLNYYSVYSVWLCIGVAGGWVFAAVRSKQNKDENAH